MRAARWVCGSSAVSWHVAAFVPCALRVRWWGLALLSLVAGSAATGICPLAVFMVRVLVE